MDGAKHRMGRRSDNPRPVDLLPSSPPKLERLGQGPPRNNGWQLSLVASKAIEVSEHSLFRETARLEYHQPLEGRSTGLVWGTGPFRVARERERDGWGE